MFKLITLLNFLFIFIALPLDCLKATELTKSQIENCYTFIENKIKSPQSLAAIFTDLFILKIDEEKSTKEFNCLPIIKNVEKILEIFIILGPTSIYNKSLKKYPLNDIVLANSLLNKNHVIEINSANKTQELEEDLSSSDEEDDSSEEDLSTSSDNELENQIEELSTFESITMRDQIKKLRIKFNTMYKVLKEFIESPNINSVLPMNFSIISSEFNSEFIKTLNLYDSLSFKRKVNFQKDIERVFFDINTILKECKYQRNHRYRFEAGVNKIKQLALFFITRDDEFLLRNNHSKIPFKDQKYIKKYGPYDFIMNVLPL